MTISNKESLLRQCFPGNIKETNYLINWAVGKKIIYVETPKVGCTAIKKTLQYAELDYKHSEMPADVHHRPTSPLRSPMHDMDFFLECLTSPDYYTFSFVRNPITRVLSAYLDKIVTPDAISHRHKKLGIDPTTHMPTFEEFVAKIYDQPIDQLDVHWAPQTFLLGYPNVKYDYLGRFEFYLPCLKEVIAKRKLKLPENALAHGKKHATNADEKIAAHYTPRTLKRVQDIYHEDFLYLGYGRSI